MQLGFTFPSDEEPKNSPPKGAPRILSVSEVTRIVRGLIEEGVGEQWVEGEISNHRRQASGHHYFTLKDESSQLACVLFSRQAAGLKDFRIEDGLHVEVFGALTVYEPRGQYQLVARTVRLRGAGALHARFEALKAKLQAEGLFDPDRKKPLPQFPARVGVVTSPTGAALRDFLHVLHRRHPGIQVVINPVRVQGRGAAREIAQAVNDFSDAPANGIPEVDVVVVTRGGGSLEDLWEFNEEVVARAVAASRVPVVSAVGHEIDFTICDFAADTRAPTPSAAAEILSADAAGLIKALARDLGRMARACTLHADHSRNRLRQAGSSALFREPSRRIETLRQTFDRAASDLERLVAACAERRRAALATAAVRFDPRHLPGMVRDRRTRVLSAFAALASLTDRAAASARSRLEKSAASLKALDPSATLARGFTITTDGDGRPVVSSKAAHAGGILLTRFADGTVRSRVERRGQ